MGILTNAGRQKILAATPLNPVNIKYMAFGTGQGAPSPAQTDLRNEVYRANASAARKDADNPLNLIIQGSIPANFPQNAGVTLFEVGLFDDSGVLIAISTLDDGSGKGQYKPPASSGVLATRFTFDFVITVANENDYNLIVNDNQQYNHQNLTNRSAADSHPISAISGLQDELDKDKQNVKLTGGQTISGNKKFENDTYFKQIASWFEGAYIQFGLKWMKLIAITGSGSGEVSINLSAENSKIDIVGDTVFSNDVTADKVISSHGNSYIQLDDDTALLTADGQEGTGGCYVYVEGATRKVTIGGDLVLLNQVTGDGSGLDEATSTKKGVSSIATQGEVNAGTDDTKIVTPKKLKDSLGATGSAPIFGARAWCNFNGGNGAIRSSGNISSVTRTGTGAYNVVFATPMPNANYAVIGNPSSAQSAVSITVEANTKTVNGFRLNAWYGGDNTVGMYDPFYADFVVFG